jgi:hypothetical protein
VFRRLRKREPSHSRAASATAVVPVLVSLGPASSDNTVVAATPVLAVGRLQNIWVASLAVVWCVTRRGSSRSNRVCSMGRVVPYAHGITLSSVAGIGVARGPAL